MPVLREPAPATAAPKGRKARKARRGRHEAKEDDREKNDRDEIADAAIRHAPPWLVSAVVHMALMIVLGLIMLPQIGGNQIELQSIWAEKLGDQLEFDSPFAGLDPTKLDDPIYAKDELPVEDPFAAPPEVEIVPDGWNATSQIDSLQIGVALEGRQKGMKEALLGRYGGTALTEQAVEQGLLWLARNQRKDGSWSLKGPYTGGAVTEDNPVAATAMALLAFQGAGNTHLEGSFKSNVARGWNWLLKQQDSAGNFYHAGPSTHIFYANGQCGIAICELYAMSKDAKLREPAEKAIGYLIRCQGPAGGWRYSPGGDSDVSVTGWIVMALQSARMAGLEVPSEVFGKIGRFLDTVAHHDGSQYGYRPFENEPRLSMTAEALLCRQYLGWARNDKRLVEGVRHITENLINYEQADEYYWYYATQVCHHMEGEHWKKWNGVMRQAIPEKQVKRGREAGSWDPGRANPQAPDGFEWSNRYTPYGGRLYVTCLSIYMLEVYYRHLPLYTNVYGLTRGF